MTLTMDGKSDNTSSGLEVDVIIIGAGVSGINAAYRIQHDAPPNTSYVILEGRDSIGGTWDVWRYPGIRSDSDIFTFSFGWNPWPGRESLAAGAKIKQYMIESAQQAGIDKNICYGHKVVSANWSSTERCWEVTVEQQHNNDETKGSVPQFYRSRFIFLGTGYYDYKEPLHSVIPGIKNFGGKLINPQHWPQDYDYAGKEMVVIGSGATAVSIVPAVAKTVKHVTMLQRSPTWYFPLLQYGKIAGLIFAIFPRRFARYVNRYRWMVQTQILLFMCRNLPTLSGAILRYATMRLVPKDMAWEKHFKPRYGPWDQRLCVVMDGDLFAALRAGQASIVTDHIDTVTKDSIVLKSGQVINADVIVAATGIQLKFGGNIDFSIDEKPADVKDRFAWKQCMLQDVPNLVFSFGYAENSWTLGADCAATVMVRLLKELQKKQASAAMPHLEKPQEMQAKPMWKLTSTYLRDMTSVFPKGGTGQWRPRGYYFADLWASRWGDLKTGLIME